jgi:membrane fusion protein (multidrug efflux system)
MDGLFPAPVSTPSRSRVRRLLVPVLALAVLAGGGFGLWHFQQQNSTVTAPAGGGRPPGPPGGVPVEAEPVTVRPLSDEVTAIGSLRSNESVMVRPEILGRITALPFTEGAAVNRGAVIVQLDESLPRAELASAEANAALARANAARQEELFARAAGSGRARDEAVAQLRTTAAQVELARARLERYRILAPFDGIVGLRRVSPGDYVKDGTDIVNVESIDPIKVDFRVPETLLASLRVGQVLDVRVDAFPDRKFPGEVFAIDPAVDPAGRSIAVRARIPNGDGLLRPGLFARVALTLQSWPQAVMVPETAIVTFGGRVLVMKVVEGRATPQPVTTGIRRGTLVHVTQGLAAGDVVITAGHMKVQPGTPVSVVAPAAPPSAGPPAAAARG